MRATTDEKDREMTAHSDSKGDSPEDSDHEIVCLLESIPEGWTRTEIDGHAWGVSRTTKVNGRIVSVYAERLDNTETISANIWQTSDGPLLKPCEMPAPKVMKFLRAAAQTYNSTDEEPS